MSRAVVRPEIRESRAREERRERVKYVPRVYQRVIHVRRKANVFYIFTTT